MKNSLILLLRQENSLITFFFLCVYKIITQISFNVIYFLTHQLIDKIKKIISLETNVVCLSQNVNLSTY